jgi:hypothetical protein
MLRMFLMTVVVAGGMLLGDATNASAQYIGAPAVGVAAYRYPGAYRRYAYRPYAYGAYRPYYGGYYRPYARAYYRPYGGYGYGGYGMYRGFAPYGYRW